MEMTSLHVSTVVMGGIITNQMRRLLLGIRLLRPLSERGHSVTVRLHSPLF